MKKTFSQSMAWLHTWGGLIFGWLLFAIFLTGSLSIFDREITHWMQPEIGTSEVPVADAVNRASDYLQTNAPDSESWLLVPPNDRNPGMAVFWQKTPEQAFQHAILDPATGQEAPRQTDGGHFFVHFHYQFNAGTLGTWIVGALGLMLLISLLTGIVIHKRIFRDFFTFRPRVGGQRTWLDAHNALSVLTLPFLLMITFSGLAIFAFMYIPSPIKLLYDGDSEAFFDEARPHVHQEPAGKPAPLLPLGGFVERARAAFGGNQVWFMTVDHQGDKNAVITAGALNEDQLTLSSQQIQFNAVTGEVLQNGVQMKPAALTQRVLAGLHFAQFGGYATHWLYFLSGLVGTVMIAAGLVLFTVKRRRQYTADNDVSTGFLRFAEKMNIAAVAGPVIACLAYLWSNRLLPVDLPGHAGWEIGIFFAVWLLSLLYSFMRTPRQAWFEQIACAAILALLLPLLNGLTTNQHLLASLSKGDWRLAGVDLTVFTLGILFAGLAARLGTKNRLANSRTEPAGWWEYAD